MISNTVCYHYSVMSAGLKLVESTNILVVIKYVFSCICKNSLYTRCMRINVFLMSIYNYNKNEMFAQKILDHQRENNKYYLYLILSE